MAHVKILIVDDSIVYRTLIRKALEGVDQLEVVGVCSNGKIALEKIQQCEVNLLILDLEMPVLSGLETLSLLKTRNWGGKAIVFSSISKRGAESSLQALHLGASDFVLKPGVPIDFEGAGSGPDGPLEKIRHALLPRIRALFPLSSTESGPATVPVPESKTPSRTKFLSPKVILIGCSTGGPTVLEMIFSRITGPFNCPIIIIQHMPPIFTTQLAERIQRICKTPTFEIQNGMALNTGSIYVAPGNYHSRVTREGYETKFVLDQGPLINSVRPAVDPVFESASLIFTTQTLAFVLTGMGADGKVGAQKIKERGGSVVIQDQKSCVVFGMPGAVFETGAYDAIATPDEIIDILCDTTLCARQQLSA